MKIDFKNYLNIQINIVVFLVLLLILNGIVITKATDSSVATVCGYCDGEQCSGDIQCKDYLQNQCIPIYDQCTDELLFFGIVQFGEMEFQVYNYGLDRECISQNYSVTTIDCNSCITSLNGYMECPSNYDSSSNSQDDNDSTTTSTTSAILSSTGSTSTTSYILTTGSTTSTTSTTSSGMSTSLSTTSAASSGNEGTGGGSGSSSQSCSNNEINTVYLCLTIISPCICILSLIIHVILYCFRKNRKVEYYYISDKYLKDSNSSSSSTPSSPTSSSISSSSSSTTSSPKRSSANSKLTPIILTSSADFTTMMNQPETLSLLKYSNYKQYTNNTTDLLTNNTNNNNTNDTS